MTETEFLKSKGYGLETRDPIYGNDGVVYWYRKVPGTESHQFIIRRWPPANKGLMSLAYSYEVEMCYETQDGIWAVTKYYGLTYTGLCANLDRLENCLKKSLGPMDADTLSYQYDGGTDSLYGMKKESSR